MKKLSSIILVIALLMQSFNSLIIIAGYELNKEYISKNLCENRAKPQMHCNGKCHMNKELKALEKKEQNPVSSAKDKQETVQYFPEMSSLILSPFNIVIKKNTIYSEAKLPEIAFSIFHPPSC